METLQHSNQLEFDQGIKAKGWKKKMFLCLRIRKQNQARRTLAKFVVKPLQIAKQRKDFNFIQFIRYIKTVLNTTRFTITSYWKR